MLKKVFHNKYFYFIIIFIFMLVFNYMTPYVSDDYQLMFDYTGTRRITSLFQIIRELYYMYFNWGGRMLAHFFAYSFLKLPKWFFNIVNSIVYVLNVYLIYLIAKGEKKEHPAILLLIHIIIFVLFPVVGQVFFWLDGSCNYSFTMLFQLLFIYLILNIKDISKKKYVLYFLISLLAGMCNENSSLSLIALLVLYMISNRDYLKIRIVSLIGLITGYLFMFLAPGNYVRMKIVGENVSFFYHFFDKLKFLIMSFWPILLAVFLFVIVFAIKCKKKRKQCIIFYLSSLIAFFAMIASPQLNARNLTFSIIYIFIIVMMMFFYMLDKTTKRIFVIILSILFVIISVTTFDDYHNYYQFMVKRKATINEAKKNKKESVNLEIYKMSDNSRIPNSSELFDIKIDCDEYPNNYMSKYYGIKIYGYYR